MQAPMTPQINLTQLNTGKADFPAHYATVQGNQNFAPEIDINLQDFITTVESNGTVDIKSIVLKFIHRFDGTNWFLTVETCQRDPNTSQLTPYGTRYDLNKGAITVSTFKGDYDPVYFANILCDGKPLDYLKDVNNVTFPWYQQIKEMACQNNLLNQQDAIIKFAACTYDYVSSPSASRVPFPHLAIPFLNTPTNGDYVNDTVYPEMFKYKAADYSGICPPCCNQYYWPQALPVVPSCLGGVSHGGGGTQ